MKHSIKAVLTLLLLGWAGTASVKAQDAPPAEPDIATLIQPYLQPFAPSEIEDLTCEQLAALVTAAVTADKTLAVPLTRYAVERKAECASQIVTAAIQASYSVVNGEQVPPTSEQVANIVLAAIGGLGPNPDPGAVAQIMDAAILAAPFASDAIMDAVSELLPDLFPNLTELLNQIQSSRPLNPDQNLQPALFNPPVMPETTTTTQGQ